MITSVDWNSDGLADGSRTVELDWKDWKRPVISLLRAKLLRNRTFIDDLSTIRGIIHILRTRFEIAVLKSTSKVSSWAERSMLCTPRVFSWSKSLTRLAEFNEPLKSRATIRVVSVGVTDIHTPSVVRIADPANEVSTRWLRAKLLPTDCSPIEETTFTGCTCRILSPLIPPCNQEMKIPSTPCTIEIRTRTTRRTNYPRYDLRLPPKATFPAPLTTRRLLTGWTCFLLWSQCGWESGRDNQPATPLLENK